MSITYAGQDSDERRINMLKKRASRQRLTTQMLRGRIARLEAVLAELYYAWDIQAVRCRIRNYTEHSYETRQAIRKYRKSYRGQP